MSAAATARVGRPAFELPLAALAGACYSLPFVYPDAWALSIGLVALLAWRCGTRTAGGAALVAWAFGTAWLAAGTWWLYVSMHRYGGLPAPLAVLAVFALCAFLSLYLAAALALYARLVRGAPLADATLFAACWLLAELARGILLTGFPWVASGYAQIDSPLAALAPWVGVYGIGFVAALLAGLGGALPLAASRRAAQRGGVALGVGLVALAALALAGPARFTQPSGTLDVTLLQTNVPQEDKFSLRHVPRALAWLAERLARAEGDLVVAPETAIPVLRDQLPPGYWEALKERFETSAQSALVGLPLGSYERGYTNSAAGLSREAQHLPGNFYRYDKYHLVPFGEFIPLGFRWFVDLMQIPLGDFDRGPLAAPSFIVHGERVAPNICYEDLFGEELAARFADPGLAPTMFANLSNIGWFGDTIAVAQHLHISRMRALEFERPMLRATNTGATAIVDHTGRVRHALQPYTEGVLEGRVEGRSGLTPFARWASRASLWPLAALALALVAIAWTKRRAGEP